MSAVSLKCFCGNSYAAREADIRRGWAKTCSKRCAAVKREYGRPNARHVTGSVVTWGKKYKRPNPPAAKPGAFDHDRWCREFDDMNDFDDPSWDAHKDSLGG